MRRQQGRSMWTWLWLLIIAILMGGALYPGGSSETASAQSPRSARDATRPATSGRQVAPDTRPQAPATSGQRTPGHQPTEAPGYPQASLRGPQSEGPTADQTAVPPTQEVSPTATVETTDPSGLPAACAGIPFSRRVDVTNASELQAAMSNAIPGDLIAMADGTYQGSFRIEVSGTSGTPIALCGSRAAILNGGSTSSSYGLDFRGSFWTLSGFTITNYLEGIETIGASSNVFTGLEIYRIGQEAIHLRAFSSDNVITDSTIWDTGRFRSDYGEGVYVGTTIGQICAKNNCLVDRSNRNMVLNNTFGPNISTEAVDIKDGVSGTIVQGNAIDAIGQTHVCSFFTQCSDQVIAVKGDHNQILDNTLRNFWRDGIGLLYYPSENSAYSYIAMSHDNVIRGNRFDDGGRWAVYQNSTEGLNNVVYCFPSNATFGVANGLYNDPCTPVDGS